MKTIKEKGKVNAHEIKTNLKFELRKFEIFLKPFEKESKVYSLELLKSIDKNYKKMFLPEMK